MFSVRFVLFAAVNFVIFPGYGANETLLVDERLASYYFCLDTREREVVKSGRISPRMVVSQSGLHSVMQCVTCINFAEPEEFWDNRRFYWKFRSWSEDEAKISLEDDPLLKLLPVEEKDDDDSNEIMDSVAGGADLDPSATTTRASKKLIPDPSFLINEPYHTLFILSVQDAKSSGEYFCFDEDDQVSAVYHLDVVGKDPYKTVGLNPDEPDWFVLPASYPEYGVEVITIWSSWTSCDRCGYVAERRRYGKCIVRPVEKHEDVPEGDWTPALQELFFLYPSGVPCRASWLPKIVQNLTEVAERPNFIHISFCKFSCIVEPVLKTITEQMEDGSIHVVEKVKRGRFSIRADIPNLPKLVVRITRNVNIGDQLSVFCPTAEERVFWRKGNDRKDSLVLSSAFLHSASAGRMYLDESSSLVFTEVLQSDDGMYSCWSHDDVLLMSAEIIVSDPSKELTLRFTLIGVAITTLSIAVGYVVYNVLSLRRSRI